MIGTFQSPAGPSESAVRTSRTIVSVSGCSALLIDDHVGDLHDAGLQGLDRVSRAGHQRQHDGVGVIDDVDLCLADPDRLEENVVEPSRVHDQRRLKGRLRQTAERSTARHGPDEDTLVEEVLGEVGSDRRGEPRVVNGLGGIYRKDRYPAIAVLASP